MNAQACLAFDVRINLKYMFQNLKIRPFSKHPKAKKITVNDGAFLQGIFIQLIKQKRPNVCLLHAWIQKVLPKWVQLWRGCFMRRERI